MSADSYDDCLWCCNLFDEWAAVNIPSGNRRAVEKLRHRVFKGIWDELCREQCRMYGKEISFTFDKTLDEKIREEEEWNKEMAESQSQHTDGDGI